MSFAFIRGGALCAREAGVTSVRERFPTTGCKRRCGKQEKGTKQGPVDAEHALSSASPWFDVFTVSTFLARLTVAAGAAANVTMLAVHCCASRSRYRREQIFQQIKGFGGVFSRPCDLCDQQLYIRKQYGRCIKCNYSSFLAKYIRKCINCGGLRYEGRVVPPATRGGCRCSRNADQRFARRARQPFSPLGFQGSSSALVYPAAFSALCCASREFVRGRQRASFPLPQSFAARLRGGGIGRRFLCGCEVCSPPFSRMAVSPFSFVSLGHTLRAPLEAPPWF